MEGEREEMTRFDEQEASGGAIERHRERERADVKCRWQMATEVTV